MPAIVNSWKYKGEPFTFSGPSLTTSAPFAVSSEGAYSFSGKPSTYALAFVTPITSYAFYNNNPSMLKASVTFSGITLTSFGSLNLAATAQVTQSGSQLVSFYNLNTGVVAGSSITYGPTDGMTTYLDSANSSSYTGTAWNDLSIYKNNATIETAPTFEATDSSLYYNGSSRTRISRNVDRDFTLLCWFRTSSNNGTGVTHWYQGGPLVDGEVGGVTNDFGLSISQGRLMFGVGNPDTTIISPLTYNNNVWHCAVATRVASTGAITLYVDGEQKASGTATTTTLTSPSVLYTGTGGNAATFVGNVAIIQVYNRAIPADEVASHFANFRTRFGV